MTDRDYIVTTYHTSGVIAEYTVRAVDHCEAQRIIEARYPGSITYAPSR
jgi:hypothetical protein